MTAELAVCARHGVCPSCSGRAGRPLRRGVRSGQSCMGMLCGRVPADGAGVLKGKDLWRGGKAREVLYLKGEGRKVRVMSVNHQELP